jgi:hypothetical protein
MFLPAEEWKDGPQIFPSFVLPRNIFASHLYYSIFICVSFPHWLSLNAEHISYHPHSLTYHHPLQRMHPIVLTYSIATVIRQNTTLKSFHIDCGEARTRSRSINSLYTVDVKNFECCVVKDNNCNWISPSWFSSSVAIHHNTSSSSKCIYC